MKRFLLHIGRHKTGTSSLQHFLFLNRAQLEAQGLYYPKSGLAQVAHHDIARHLHVKQRQALPPPERRRLAQTMRALREEISPRTDTVLLSSEAFQNCQPQWLAAHFVPQDTRVVVYIREQVDYLVSSYQQKVHATGYAASLAEYADEVAINYDAFLTRWERVFGRERVQVRAYSRTRLVEGDIVADFGGVLGLALDQGYERPTDDQNPSIGGALLELKRLVNRRLGDTGRTALPVYKAFSGLANAEAALRRKPTLTADHTERIRRLARASNQRVFERHFGGEDVFDLAACPAPSPGAPIDRDGIAAVVAALERSAPAVHQALCSVCGVATLCELGTADPSAGAPRPNLY